LSINANIITHKEFIGPGIAKIADYGLFAGDELF
jgi:hypothetical protein